MAAMGNDQYGLSGRPFQLTPDPRFWFESATHKKAMAYLGYGLAQGEGFVVITGEVGAGKTTLSGHLIESLDLARVNAVRLVSTQLSGDDLLRSVAIGLALPIEGMDKSHLLARIEAHVRDRDRAGQRTLLIVDEAQGLSHEALEELRMLSNFQGADRALIQTLLLGQPEFRERIDTAPELEQLRQRVIASHHLTAMGADEVGAYVLHRMKLVGWTGAPAFAENAFAALHRHSGGLPRRINHLMTRVLLLGSIEQAGTIDAALVDAVAADLAQDHPGPDQGSLRLVEGGVPDTHALDHAARIAMLEAQVEEQGAALRRVLSLMVEWTEAPEPQPGDIRRAPAR
jgi:general secretion pathway protein A